jgi:putative transposase
LSSTKEAFSAYGLGFNLSLLNRTHVILAKSISDASWSMFRQWVEYFGKVFGKVTVAVPPHYTSQNCSNCGKQVVKTLSERTHHCLYCGTVLDRDHNAALNILAIGLNRVGHTQIHACGEFDLMPS